MRFSRPLLVLLLIALVAGACGDDNTAVTNDDGGSGAQTVDVTMSDNDFDPASLEVERGETVTFVFENTGAVDHDAFIGDAEAQADHDAEMNESDDMGEGEAGGDMADTTEMGDHGATADDAITVAPGETGELTYTFDQPGQLEIGCHEPGHYDAGMKILVNVT